MTLACEQRWRRTVLPRASILGFPRASILGGLVLALAWSMPASAELRRREAARQPHTELPSGRTEHAAHLVDQYFERVWSEAGVRPGAPVDDATFLRRASLALNGVPATRDEVVRFLEDSREDKRARKVDELLVRSRYADYWGFRLRQWVVDLREVKGQGASMRNFYFYTREAMAENRSWARIARDFLATQASQDVDGAVNFGIWFSVEPGEYADAASRFFLGTNLSCARCHDHPYIAEWPRESYWGLAAFFARAQTWKGDTEGAEFRARFPALARNPESVSTLPGGDRSVDGGGGEKRAIYDAPEGEMKYPDAKDETVIQPVVLGAAKPDGVVESSGTRRERFVEWMVAPEVPYFRRAAVNRFWALLTGRGFVDRLDGFTPDAPVRHEALLESLSRAFAANGYDIKWLFRTIVLSRVFQLPHGPDGAEDPARETWHARPRRLLNSDQWFDSVVRVTGEETRIYAMADTLAPLLEKEHHDRVERRRETILAALEALSEKDESRQIGYVPQPPVARELDAAVRDLLEDDAELERLNGLRAEYMKVGLRQERYRGQLRRGMSPTSRSLLRMNGDLVSLCIANGWTVSEAGKLTDFEERVGALFLAVLGRYPARAEVTRLRDSVDEADPEHVRDLLWALIQTDEFQTF